MPEALGELREEELEAGAFLSVLCDEDRELFMETARDAHSDVEIWTLAVVLGYQGTMSSLIRWVGSVFPGRDRRDILKDEAEKLEQDLKSLRAEIEAGLDDSDGKQLWTRVAGLSKELRSHLVEIDKMTRVQDRRGLVMAGAEKVVKELRQIFRDSPEMSEALDLGLRAAWAALGDD